MIAHRSCMTFHLWHVIHLWHANLDMSSIHDVPKWHAINVWRANFDTQLKTLPTCHILTRWTLLTCHSCGHCRHVSDWGFFCSDWIHISCSTPILKGRKFHLRKSSLSTLFYTPMRRMYEDFLFLHLLFLLLFVGCIWFHGVLLNLQSYNWPID
jgi:hypothetical protein